MKHDFNKKIKRPDFTDRIEKLKINYHGRLVRYKHNKVQHEDPQERKKGYVDPDFVTNKKLKINTRPERYS